MERNPHSTLINMRKKSSPTTAVPTATANLSQPSSTPKETCAASTRAVIRRGPIKPGGIKNLFFKRVWFGLNGNCQFRITDRSRDEIARSEERRVGKEGRCR